MSTTLIEETRALQRQRRSLSDAFEDAQSAREIAEKEMRQASDRYASPEYLGGTAELEAAREKLRNARAELQRAADALQAFDETHGTGDLAERERQLIEEQKAQRIEAIKAEIRENTEKRLALIVPLRPLEQRIPELLTELRTLCPVKPQPWGSQPDIASDIGGVPKAIRSPLPPGMWSLPHSPNGGLFDLLRVIYDWDPTLLASVPDEILAEINVKKPEK
jgi:hypothetical protein